MKIFCFYSCSLIFCCIFSFSPAFSQNGGQWDENGCGKIGYKPNDTIIVCNKENCTQTRRLKVNGVEQIVTLSANACDTFIFQSPIWEAKSKPTSSCSTCDKGWIEVRDFPLPLVVMEFKSLNGCLKWVVDEYALTGSGSNNLSLQYSKDCVDWTTVLEGAPSKSTFMVEFEGYYRLYGDNQYSKIVHVKKKSTSIYYFDQFGQKYDHLPSKPGWYFETDGVRVQKKIWQLE